MELQSMAPFFKAFLEPLQSLLATYMHVEHKKTLH